MPVAGAGLAATDFWLERRTGAVRRATLFAGRVHEAKDRVDAIRLQYPTEGELNLPFKANIDRVRSQ